MSHAPSTCLIPQRHLQCVVTGLVILFGLWLTTTIIIILIVAPYCRGRNLLGRYSLPPPNLNQKVLTYSETDTHRLHAYRDWVKNMGKKQIECGIDCLFYSLDAPVEKQTQAPPEPSYASTKLPSGQCEDVPLSERFDCLPSASPNQEECVARGCCWKEVLEVCVDLL